MVGGLERRGAGLFFGGGTEGVVIPWGFMDCADLDG